MDGGAIGELLFYIIKYGVLIISLVGIIRLWVLHKDNERHLLTKIITSITSIFTLFLFIQGYRQHNIRMVELAGDYEVQKFKCEECIECKATLIKDGTFKLKRNNVLIDSGNWDFKDVDFDVVLQTYLIFNGQRTSSRELDSKKIISSIKSEECINEMIRKMYEKIDDDKH